eukprot:jgi/Psemu1/45695/gm1.45695_g
MYLNRIIGKGNTTRIAPPPPALPLGGTNGSTGIGIGNRTSSHLQSLSLIRASNHSQPTSRLRGLLRPVDTPPHPPRTTPTIRSKWPVNFPSSIESETESNNESNNRYRERFNRESHSESQSESNSESIHRR